MSERKVTLYIKSKKSIKKIIEHGYKTFTVTGIGRTARRGRRQAPPRVFPTWNTTTTKVTEKVVPEDQKETIEIVTELAPKYGFRVEVIDTTKQNFLARQFSEHLKGIRVFPTIIIDGKRFKGTMTRRQIEALLSRARVN